MVEITGPKREHSASEVEPLAPNIALPESNPVEELLTAAAASPAAAVAAANPPAAVDPPVAAPAPPSPAQVESPPGSGQTMIPATVRAAGLGQVASQILQIQGTLEEGIRQGHFGNEKVSGWVLQSIKSLDQGARCTLRAEFEALEENK